MAYTHNVHIVAGRAYIGTTTGWSASVYNGASLVSTVTSGIQDNGDGTFDWALSVADDTQGRVVITFASKYVYSEAINPRVQEYANVKTSTVPASVLSSTVKGTYTVSQALAVIAAVLAGKVSGATGGETTITIRHIDDSGSAVVATVDASGNRNSVTVTP